MTETGPGHNQPSMIEHATETTSALSEWMAEHPVVQTEDEAREGKLLVDRAKDAVHEMETERGGLVGPLNERVKTINDRYRRPKGDLEHILRVLVMRLDAYVQAEEKKRHEEAEAKRKLLADAELVARRAEEAEQEAEKAASVGELGVDIAKTTQNADAAFALYKKAKRESNLAERNATVRIGGGFRRALSLRNQEILEVTDWSEAISFMGLTDRIRDAILTEARAFRKEFEELPPGITAKYDRSL